MRYVILLALLAVAACAPVVDEKRTRAVLSSGYYAGEPYYIVTRMIEGRNGPYAQTRVEYWGRSAPCRAESPTDCEKAARRLIDQRFTHGFF